MKLELTINELKELVGNDNSNLAASVDPCIDDDMRDHLYKRGKYYIGSYAGIITDRRIETIITIPFQDKEEAVERILDMTWDDCVSPREIIKAELIDHNLSYPVYVDSTDNDEFLMSYEIHEIYM